MSDFLTSTWLFDSLLITSLLMAAILLVRRPVAKIFGAGVAYALWLIPAARLLMPSLTGNAAPVGESSQSVRDAVRESILAGVSSGEPTVAVATSPSVDFAAMAIALWLGGAALFFIVQTIRYASMRDDLLSEAEEFAVVDRIRIVMSDQVAGPLAFGLFKRYIAVPLDFTKSYSPAERELAIAHEMAHHKSGDLFANLAAFIVLCLQWFNPLAWISWNAFRFDQEAACDARVLAGKNATDREIYGRALARTAFDGVPTFATALNSPKTIIERLRRLAMKDASKQRRSLGQVGILASAAVILPLTATIVAPVDAHDEALVETSPHSSGDVKVVQIRKDGTVESVGSRDRFVKKVKRSGRTFQIHTDRRLSDTEVDDMVAKADVARSHAANMIVISKKLKGDAQVMRVHAESMRNQAETMKKHHRSIFIKRPDVDVDVDIDVDVDVDVDDHAIAKAVAAARPHAHIPRIEFKEITKNCRQGENVSTAVSGFGGNGHAQVNVVMCGKGHARIARVASLDGLRDARQDVSTDSTIPENVRKDIVEKLNKQIRRLEVEIDRTS